MKHVSVIGTYHKDSGFAKASELLAILVRIRPEVIFLETHATEFDDFPNAHPLESTAVNGYSQIQQVALVPVDQPTPPDEFFANYEELVRAVERRSSDFCRLFDRHSQYVRASGFAYLNSDDCSTLWSELHEATLSAIERLADRDRLGEIYRTWCSTNELRERAMIKNIEDYCQHNAFDSGVLLVGAAHRQSIIDKSSERTGADPPSIQLFPLAFPVHARHDV